MCQSTGEAPDGTLATISFTSSKGSYAPSGRFKCSEACKYTADNKTWIFLSSNTYSGNISDASHVFILFD